MYASFLSPHTITKHVFVVLCGGKDPRTIVITCVRAYIRPITHSLIHAPPRVARTQAPALTPTEIAMAIQGLSRLLPLTLDAASSPSSDGSSPLPPALLPRLATALHDVVRKPPDAQGRADEGLLGSPHLALTIASLPRLAREGTGGGSALCSPAFVALLRARVGERVDGMQAWERDLVTEGLKGLGWKAAG